MKNAILIISTMMLGACTGVPASTQALGAGVIGVLAAQAIQTHEDKAVEREKTKQLETIMETRKVAR